MPLKEATYKHYKAITNEASVNPKNRFDKNNIEWVEDLTYRGTHNRAFFIKLPVAMTAKPNGCKKMHFIKYFPGPDQEYITYTDAGLFYSTIYPRYEHIAEYLQKYDKKLTPWVELTESQKQHFVKLWGKQILARLLDLQKWRTSVSNRTEHTFYYKRPTDIGTIADESLSEFTTDHARKTFTISCYETDLERIISNLVYDSPEIYITEVNRDNNEPDPVA